MCLEDLETVRGLQAELNIVLDRMSLDREFIIEHLTPVALHDEFVAGTLWA